jgi:dienelactone hydrolase
MAPFGTYDMAGNLKEWTANATTNRRYILGGAWDESAYAFVLPDARSPFDRELTFGFRCVRRLTAPPAGSFAPLDLEQRATAAASKPVSAETYKVLLRLHAYEKSDLDARVDPTPKISLYWRRETVTLRAAYSDERVMAHLFLPTHASPPYQAVAVMGGATIVDSIKSVDDFDYPYEFIIRSGRAVLIPAYFGTLERGPTPLILPPNQERERAVRWSMDLGRSIDYLETRSDIDTRKLGFYGISWGAAHGVRLIAVDGRFKAAVLSSGGLVRNQPTEVDSWNFAPRLRVPVLMVNGKDDIIFPVETNQQLLFRSLGAQESDKRHRLYDGGHRNLVTRPDLIGEILNWFDRYLGSVEPPD